MQNSERVSYCVEFSSFTRALICALLYFCELVAQVQILYLVHLYVTSKFRVVALLVTVDLRRSFHVQCIDTL